MQIKELIASIEELAGDFDLSKKGEVTLEVIDIDKIVALYHLIPNIRCHLLAAEKAKESFKNILKGKTYDDFFKDPITFENFDYIDATDKIWRSHRDAILAEWDNEEKV